MTIEERASVLEGDIETIVTHEPGDVSRAVRTRCLKALQAERDDAEITLKRETISKAYKEGQDDMRQMAAKRMEELHQEVLAKEIRTLK